MKILVPVDTSDTSRRMLDYLAGHADLLAGDHEYTLFTVLAPQDLPSGSHARCASYEDAYRQVAEEILRPALELAKRRGWVVQTDYVPGTAVPAIVAKAEAVRADLIMMGTHARSPLGAAVLGSVAHGVLARCSVPTLLIR